MDHLAKFYTAWGRYPHLIRVIACFCAYAGFLGWLAEGL